MRARGHEGPAGRRLSPLPRSKPRRCRMSIRQDEFQVSADQPESVRLQIERALPYDGPHSTDTVRDAAGGVYVLVRYLNNVTGPSNGETTLRLAPSVDDVLGGLHSAAYAMDQLLNQLAGALTRQADDPT